MPVDAPSLYWQEFVDLKGHAIYIDLYLEKVERQERMVNVFLAVTSSGAIGSWALWQHAAFVWAAQHS